MEKIDHGFPYGLDSEVHWICNSKFTEEVNMMTNTSREYIVWVRNDGYVGVTVGMPNGWVQPNDGKVISFVKLGEFRDWCQAHDCVEIHRRGQHG